MKFRKKPVVVEAMQFTMENKDRVFRWASEIQMNIYPAFRGSWPALLVPTKEGEMVCEIEDWLVKEPFPTHDRKFYPCKPDIFEQTYEPVEEQL